MDIKFGAPSKGTNHHRGYEKPKDDDSEVYRTSYLNIWKEIPSYKDINLTFSLPKAILLVGITAFLILTTFFTTLNLYFSFIAPMLFIIALMVVFRDNMFLFDSFLDRKYGKIDLFHHIAFWKTIDDEFTIYISNKKDLLHTGIRIFKIAVIPENVRPNLNHLIKSLYAAQIPFTYQVVQNPIYHNEAQTMKIDIYFAFSYYVNGALTTHKLLKIKDALEEFSYTFKSMCIANLAHFKVVMVAGEEMIHAIQTFILGTSTKISKGKSTSLESSILPYLKGFLIIGLLVYVDLLLFSYMDFLFIIIINGLLIGLYFMIFWREALFSICQFLFIRDEKEEISHFHSLAFYRVRGYNQYLFQFTEDKLLMAISLLNLEYTTPPQFNREGYFLSHPDKFFRSIVNTQIPYTYTLLNSPINYEKFERYGLKHLTDFHRDMVLKRERELEREQWLQMRAGMWRCSQLISIHEVQYAKKLSKETFDKLITQLDYKLKEFINIYKSNFPNYELVLLGIRRSISAMIATLLKSKFYRLAGTHLDYSIIQGKTLMSLCEIANEFKKGVATRIAAEFNSPLHIENEIVLGETLNTEFLEGEIPAGFTLEQVKRLLITNGSRMDRETVLLTLAAELVKNDIPSIIFDFSGTFSKLLTYFEGTSHESNLLHFKLGRSYQIDPIMTDIKNDKFDEKYTDLLMDAWGMSFKENDRAINTLKSYVKKFREKGDASISAIALEIETSKEWQKSPYADSILSMLKEFTEDAIYIPNVDEEKKEMPHKPKDFIQREETIIIDMSILRDLEQKVFISAVFLAKIIHYVGQYDDYREKIFIFPNADIFFDNWYLDKFNHLRYGKVSKFLEPLYRAGFGFAITANQVRYLHPNTLNYFTNVISFKTVDKRDISSLKNIMNLSELHGVGYYSKTRKDSYQVDFLVNLQPNEALVRRDDYSQPYPIEVSRYINDIPEMDYKEIIKYMDRQGFDLKSIENRILSNTDKTLFETHFENYIVFLEEIITFFNVLGRLDEVGNLYKAKIKEQLLKLIYPKAKERFHNDTAMIKEARDRLFDILLRHNYIVEDHPRRASGSQSIRTSYSVGPQYRESLDDYYRSKDNSPLNVSVETVEKESESEYELEELFPSDESNEFGDPNDSFSPEKIPLQPQFDQHELEKTFQRLLMKDYFFDLSQINLKLRREKFEDALMLEKEILRTFLVDFYCEFHPDEKNEISNGQTEKALEFIDEYLDLPVAKSKFYELLDLPKLEDVPDEERPIQIRNNFKILLQFFHTLQDSILKKQPQRG